MKVSIVAVNPEMFASVGKEYWREDDRVYVDDIYVAFVEKHAEWISKETGQPHFLRIAFCGQIPNKYLVGLPTRDAKRLFREGKIKSYFVLNVSIEGLPKCFTLVSVSELQQFDKEYAYQLPVFCEYVKV